MKQRYTLEESWFSENREENRIKPETWKTALNFERCWLKNYEVDPEWWNVTPYGSIVLDLEVEDGLVSIEFGGTQILMGERKIMPPKDLTGLMMTS